MLTPAQTDAITATPAINLALSGKLTDNIPECMSPTIGRWIIKIQDAMPASIRDSAEWHSLLPLAAGTGREREKERAAVALDWMWGTVLPQLQPIADKGGYGEAWRQITTERSGKAAYAAADSAATAAAAAADAAFAAFADAAFAATAAATAAAADAAADAAFAATTAAAYWHAVNPCACLQKMIDV